jgi:endonuclease YncB( thermonuclease family)
VIDVPPGAVVNQPDGDTFHVFAFQPGGVVKIRVEGVNTPERNQPGWAEAKAFTKAWLASGPFRVTTCGKPTIDRIVGKVERDGKTLAQDLIDHHHSR